MCLAIPGRVAELSDDGHFAMVEVSGVRRKINIDLVAPDGIGVDDWVLIHVGFAMSKIGEDEAKEQIKLLEMLGEADDARIEIEGYGRLDPGPVQ